MDVPFLGWWIVVAVAVVVGAVCAVAVEEGWFRR